MKPCVICGIPIDELTESHVKEGYPERNWWHIHCWNDIHADSPDVAEQMEREYQNSRPQTLADVGMCEADFR